MLLDDIFDKLDAGRVEQIVKLVSGDSFGQIFITDTNRDHLDRILEKVNGEHRVFVVENGVVAERSRTEDEVVKRGNTELLADVVRQFLRQERLEAPLNEYRLVDAWKDVVGPAVARYTLNLFIRNQTLCVQLSSSVLRQELMMYRKQLVKSLNDRVGAQVIVDIEFR
mgnify:CR=1 FL=1